MAFIKEIQTPDNIKHQIKNTIIPVVGTQTASTGSWTGTIDLPEVYDGLTIAYFLPYAGSGNATLNLTLSDGTTTGAVNCYYNTGRLTTHFGKGSNIIMTYWSAGSIKVDGTATTDNRWIVNANYVDGNDQAYQLRAYYNRFKAGPNKVFPWTLIMQCADGRWESIVTSSSTGTSKICNSHGFRLGQIALMYANATYNENVTIGDATIYEAYTSGLVDHRYSFNTANNATNGTISVKPVYLVGALNATDGLFYLDSSKWWTQDLPTTNDGKLYIYLGDAFDYYRMSFRVHHPIYWYKNGALREFSQDAATVSGYTVNKDVPSDAIFTDTTYSAGTGLSLSGTTFNHSNSITAGTAKGDDSKTLTFGDTFTIPSVTYDVNGHITGKGTTTMTMPSGGILSSGLEIRGHIAGDSGSTGHGLYGGGGYHNAYNNLLLHGDASTGSSGIAFVSDKVNASTGVITNVNQPSDRAFIQYHACGITTATAEGTNPTLATSGEAGRLVIGIGNDSGDKIWFQAPGQTDLIHQRGATSAVIPDTGNISGTVGSSTRPVYVNGGVLTQGDYTLAAACAKGVVTSIDTSANLPTSNAVKTYVDTAIDNLPEPMVFKGSLGTGGTITALPVDGSAKIGDTYKVITDGTYNKQAAKVGDLFICDSKTETSNTWTYIPSADEPSGTVTSVTIKATSPIAIDSSSAITTSGTRTISHANSGVSAGTYRSVTVNATGHVTSGTNPTTLSGYGITDAKISNGVITLGSNTITPLTSHQTVTDNNPTLSWGTKSKVATIGSTDINVTMPSNPNTDTKVNVTLATTTKAYLLGTSTTPTSTAQGVTSLADTGVYLTTTAGQLAATTFAASGGVYVNTANSGSVGGMALYATSPTDYGIAMRGTGTATGNLGKHGFVQGDWAGYFNFTGAVNRGWIFRHAGANIGSINGEGKMVLNGSLTVGGNTTNTSGCRLEYNTTTASLDFIFN